MSAEAVFCLALSAWCGAFAAALAYILLWQRAKREGAADRARLDWLEDLCLAGVAELGVEIDGGVFLDYVELGSDPVTLREQNNVRAALDRARGRES